jgi:acylphosphatase
MTPICVRFTISGLVQGVWYRATAQQKAIELGLTGWARNLKDGNVELVACGNAMDIKKLEDWLWQGPPKARVENVSFNEIEWTDFTEFEVR